MGGLVEGKKREAIPTEADPKILSSSLTCPDEEKIKQDTQNSNGAAVSKTSGKDVVIWKRKVNGEDDTKVAKKRREFWGELKCHNQGMKGRKISEQITILDGSGMAAVAEQPR